MKDMSRLIAKHFGSFILLLLVTVLPFCIAQSTYYVKPTLDTPCHEDPCHTLSVYVSKAKHYFTSNTTIAFLPDEHTLQESVNVRSIGGLALQRSSSSLARIVCTNNTFIFNNLSSIEVTGLSFVSCRFQLNISQAIFQDIQYRGWYGRLWWCTVCIQQFYNL